VSEKQKEQLCCIKTNKEFILFYLDMVRKEKAEFNLTVFLFLPYSSKIKELEI